MESVNCLRFQVLRAAGVNITLLWAKVLRSLVEMYRHFGIICCFHFKGLTSILKSRDQVSKKRNVYVPDYTMSRAL